MKKVKDGALNKVGTNMDKRMIKARKKILFSKVSFLTSKRGRKENWAD